MTSRQDNMLSRVSKRRLNCYVIVISNGGRWTGVNRYGWMASYAQVCSGWYYFLIASFLIIYVSSMRWNILLEMIPSTAMLTRPYISNPSRPSWPCNFTAPGCSLWRGRVAEILLIWGPKRTFSLPIRHLAQLRATPTIYQVSVRFSLIRNLIMSMISEWIMLKTWLL